MSKNNYPKKRKPRDTSYSMTHKLIEKFGQQQLYEIWVQYNGMYGAAKYLSEKMGENVSPSVIRYLSNKFNWVRVIKDKESHLYKAVKRGTVPKGYYKHIKFVEG